MQQLSWGALPSSSTGRTWVMAKIKFSLSQTLWAGLLLSLPGCIGGEVQLTTSTTTSSPTTSTSASVPSGPRAARIIFKNSYPNGSFDTAPSAGTIVTPGSGHTATRIFNADGSLLAQGGPTSSAWPSWLQGVEIGISGGDNSSATNSNCARFAVTNENTTTCDYDPSSTNSATPCGAQAGLFRVSEFDCVNGGATQGNGGPNDGVYVRAYFSRDSAKLGANENILAVLEYSSAGLRKSASDPTSCFSGGSFSPTQANCADFVWNVFLKHNAYEVVQPYLMLIPPAFGVADFANTTGAAAVGSKQFIIPLAADSGINTVQLSRIWGMPVGTTAHSGQTFQQTCDSNGDNTGNSPHCVGVVLHTLTFFRM